MSLFKLRGELKPVSTMLLTFIGFLLFLGLWVFLTIGEVPIITAGILPKPINVVKSIGEMYQENDLIMNVCRSLGINLAGYLESLAIAIPVGFLIGLLPIFRGTFQSHIDAIRYVPLTAVTGLFIVWFGIGVGMKVHFLAFGILIYLLPMVVIRIKEVNDVYVKTVYTLGASQWQTVKTVFIPAVLSKLFDDIRVLTAISWTYIIVAENIGNEGGVGSLIWRAGQRQGRYDKVFALLIIIIIIGIIQDQLFKYLDREFFPHKFQGKSKHESKIRKKSNILYSIWSYSKAVLGWTPVFIYVLLFANEFYPIISNRPILSHLFGGTTNVVHLVVFAIILYKLYRLFIRQKLKKIV